MSVPTPPPPDDERVVEEVARAMYAADGGRMSWEEIDQYDHDEYRRLAVAAVAAYRAAQDGGAEEAVFERVRRLVVDHGIRDDENGELFADRLDDVPRAALAPQAGDGAW